MFLNAVKSTADLFDDDDDEGDLFKEKPAISPGAASTTKETESHRETVTAKKVMEYKWIISSRFEEEVITAAEVIFPCKMIWKCHVCEAEPCS